MAATALDLASMSEVQQFLRRYHTGVDVNISEECITLQTHTQSKIAIEVSYFADGKVLTSITDNRVFDPLNYLDHIHQQEGGVPTNFIEDWLSEFGN